MAKDKFSTLIEATKGGVLIYVKNGTNFKPRNDLKVYKPKELESIFIEVINEKETYDIVGVIYKHPRMNASEFINDHLKSIVDKLFIENKKVFIAGDLTLTFLIWLCTMNHWISLMQ